MVILIGGPGNTGKTLLAHQLMVRYAIPYTSVDHLKMGLYRSDPGCGFTPLDAAQDLGAKLWPMVREIMKTNIENRQNIIMEGCYLFPDMVRELEEEYARHVVDVYLGFADAYVRAQHNRAINGNRRAIEDKEWDSGLEELLRDHAGIREVCGRYGGNYFEIREDYVEEMQAVVRFLDGEVEKRGSKTIGVYPMEPFVES